LFLLQRLVAGKVRLYVLPSEFCSGDRASSGFRPRNVLHFTLLSEPERSNYRRLSVVRPSMIEIVRRAYELWEQAGKPDGKDQEFYHQAERELTEAEEAADKTDQMRGGE
jgi:hypothetical protein